MEGSRQAGVPASAGPFSSSTGYQQQQQQQQQLPLKFSGNVSEANNGARSGGSGASQPKPIRRRMRMITSCLECRRRKLKCDKSQPCGHCLKNSRECLYLNPRLDEASQLRLTRFKDKVGSLEKQLEHNVVSSAASAGAGLGGRSGPLLADEVAHRDEDEDVSLGLEPADLANVDLAYEDDADGGADDLVDLGVLVGKMRITERVGGLARPRLIEEIQAGIGGQPVQPPLGQSQPGSQPIPATNAEFWPGMPIDSWPDFLRPSTTYIPPSSSFMMGQASSMNTLSLEQILPTRSAADRLIQQYFEAVHPVARCVHAPSFHAEYADFWSHVYENVEPRPSLQALVFAALFSAAVGMDEATAVREFGRSYKSLHETLKLSVEMALSKAHFLRTTRVQTLQAFVMYMIVLCRDEVSRAHSVLVGAAVRLAECMGLHRDPQTYGLNPLDTHVRRLIWHQLCFLDIRTCEAQGPRPSIRRDDYDTQLPLNCNDSQFFRPADDTTPVPEPQPQRCWTHMLFPLIRFEINEMMRILWVDRRKLETRRITLTTLLSKIEAFRKSMLTKYDPLLNDAVSIQRYARLVMNLHLYRLHVMALTMYHAPTIHGTGLPPRLNRVLVTSAIMILEIGIQLETDPLFHLWAWYCGAYHQFHVALLLASEVYVHPDHVDADRVWPCLDYVFKTDRSLPPERKCLQILGEIVHKTTAYRRLRKARTPIQSARVNLDSNGSRKPAEHQKASTIPVNPQPYQQQPPPSFAEPPQGSVNAPPQPRISHQAPPQTQAPSPSAVYAGISDGQTLWSAPILSYADTSEEASPSSAPGSGGAPATGPSPDGNIQVDWDVLNGLFMNDPQTGELTISGFGDPSLGMNWQY